MWSIGAAFIILLVWSQIYLFKRTHRVFNVGLLLATILFAASLLYSTNTLNSVKSDLQVAKQEAFDSLNNLWSARAEAYNANALESLYLLHNGTGIVQTADTINFNLASTRIISDPKAALGGEKFEGYLKKDVNNSASNEEKLQTDAIINEWGKYVEIDKQIRNLEYDSKHNEAIALCVGTSEGQSNNIFAKFDAALAKDISLNQESFDKSINSAFKVLDIFPYITAVFLIGILATCVLGLKARIDEYKV
jgi:hypothetical protein